MHCGQSGRQWKLLQPFSTILSFIFSWKEVFAERDLIPPTNKLLVSIMEKKMSWRKKNKLQRHENFTQGWKMPVSKKALFFCKSELKAHQTLGMCKRLFCLSNCSRFSPKSHFRPSYPIFNLKQKVQLLEKDCSQPGQKVQDLFGLCPLQRGP